MSDMRGKVLTTQEMVKVLPDGRESLAIELEPSNLYNEENAPAPFEIRNWSTITTTLFWFAMIMCVPSWMVAGGMLQYFNWWEAFLAIMFGAGCMTVMVVLNAVPAARYGIPMPVVSRASFGIYGAHVATFARLLIAAGWCGIELWIGAQAINGIITVFDPGWAKVAGNVWYCYVGFLALHVALVLTISPTRALGAFKVFNWIAVPVMLVIGFATLIWAVNAAGISALASIKGGGLSNLSGLALLGVVVPLLFGVPQEWTDMQVNVADCLRYAKDYSSASWGSIAGMMGAWVVFSLFGLFSAGAGLALWGKTLWNPIDLMTKIGSAGAVFALVFFVALTVSTNVGANLVAGGNMWSNFYPKKIRWRHGALITLGIGVLWLPWKFLATYGDYVFNWFFILCSIMGPIVGIFVADYWIVHKKKYYLYDLYVSNGVYSYWNGFNPVAFITWAICSIISVTIAFPIGIWWLTSVVLPIPIYIGLMKVWGLKKYQPEYFTPICQAENGQKNSF